MATKAKGASEPRHELPDEKDFNPFIFSLPRETDTRLTTYLVIPSVVGDDGTRPIPGNPDLWLSPCVWTLNQLGIDQPIVGQPNQVFARVCNFGLQAATGVQVKYFWTNPSIAITPATAHLIGTAYVNIPSGWNVAVQCPTPWVPVWENGGHECLFAEASIQVFDPVTAPFSPGADRHVAQKNEQLIVAPSGSNFTVKLDAVNTGRAAQAVTIEVIATRQKTVPPAVATRAAALRMDFRPPTGILPLSLRMGDARPIVGKEARPGKPQIVQKVELKRGEARTFQIEGRVPPTAKPGETFTFNVVQRSREQIDGGYTVSVLVVKDASRAFPVRGETKA